MKKIVAVLVGVLCLSLGFSSARADETGGNSLIASRHTYKKKAHYKKKVQSEESVAPQVTPAPAASKSDGYVNIGKIGAGPSLDIVDVPANVGSASSLGTIDARYWVNKRFGFDMGVGFGLPEASPKSEFLGTYRAEGMFALKESAHNVFYADAEIMPGFLSGSGSTPFFMALESGIGLEHALTEIPNVSLYTEWEPLSINLYNPGGYMGVGFLGSVINFTTGLRYYF